MRVLLGVVAETVVNGRIRGLQFDLVNQFAPPGSGQSGRGKLSPPAFGQDEVLYIGSVVGRQFQGPGEKRT